MFDRESRPTVTESVVVSADSAVELADSITDSAKNPLKIGLWVRALKSDFRFHEERVLALKLLNVVEIWT